MKNFLICAVLLSLLMGCDTGGNTSSGHRSAHQEVSTRFTPSIVKKIEEPAFSIMLAQTYNGYRGSNIFYWSEVNRSIYPAPMGKSELAFQDWLEDGAAAMEAAGMSKHVDLREFWEKHRR